MNNHNEGSYSPRTGRVCTLRSLFSPINYPSLQGRWFSAKSDLPLVKTRAAAAHSRINFHFTVFHLALQNQTRKNNCAGELASPRADNLESIPAYALAWEMSVQFQSGRMRKSCLRKLAQVGIVVCGLLLVTSLCKQSTSLTFSSICLAGGWKGPYFLPSKGDTGDLGFLCPVSKALLEVILAASLFQAQPHSNSHGPVNWKQPRYPSLSHLEKP